MDRPLQTRTYLCYARSDGEGWEALCVDLDIAVQGDTLDEVVATINEAIASYIADAKAEDAATASRLLARRAPLLVRVGYFFRAVGHLLSPRDRSRAAASFDVTCPA